MYNLEKLGWIRLSNNQLDMSLIQQEGYFEIFCSKRNGLELTLFEGGGLTICRGSWSDMSPEEVKAMNEDFKLVAALTYADNDRLDVVRNNNSAEDDMKELVGIDEFGLNRHWRYTKQDFNVKGFGIIHAKSDEGSEVQIYVDDVNPVKEFKADILIITDDVHEHYTFNSSMENNVLDYLDEPKREPYKVAKDLLEYCIQRVRS